MSVRIITKMTLTGRKTADSLWTKQTSTLGDAISTQYCTNTVDSRYGND